VTVAGTPARGATSNIRSIADKGFSFPKWLITDYLLSLGTKPFVLLSGISGTGKTKMAQLVAEYPAPSQSGSVASGRALA
jgi:hypothetical protein